MRWFTLLALGALVSGADAQPRRRTPVRQTAPAVTTEAVALACPHELGQGVTTQRVFCDIQADTDPLAGAIVRLPPHRGPALLTFDLHNRHMYSAELVEGGRGYTRATATIGVLAMDKTLLTRAVVQTEFRRAADLFDRIAAGAGMAGMKAVAPIGSEPVSLEISEGFDAVSILGEKLVIVRTEATETISGTNRPIAVVSNARLQYRPGPPPRKPPRRR
jgi:hypothetical protein